MESQRVTPRTYLVIFLALLALLVLTVAAAFVDLDRLLHGRYWSISVALLIAIAKGLLIMMYFMHVKVSPHRIVVSFATAGFIWLSILFVLTFTDYLTRNHPPQLNYKGEPHRLAEVRAD
jgi:cytochrome c oxidase subunit 4